jgi:hypothetical protein
LIHYTPPPFVAIILPCIYPSVKLLMKTRSEWSSFAPSEARSEAMPGDSLITLDCEDYVKRQGSGLRVLWQKRP